MFGLRYHKYSLSICFHCYFFLLSLTFHVIRKFKLPTPWDSASQLPRVCMSRNSVWHRRCHQQATGWERCTAPAPGDAPPHLAPLWQLLWQLPHPCSPSATVKPKRICTRGEVVREGSLTWWACGSGMGKGQRAHRRTWRWHSRHKLSTRLSNTRGSRGRNWYNE